MTMSLTTVSARPTRTPADWVGCAFFGAFALALPLTSGRVGLMLLPPMFYELLVAATFLVRGPARRALSGTGPRVAAYGATFAVPIFLWGSQRWEQSWISLSTFAPLRFVGAGTWLLGAVIAFWPVWYMRRSFSIEPAARELATGGPYRLARHPIYATQIVIYAGLFLMHATIAFGLAMIAWFVLLRVRVGYEERVLRAEYREYDRYRLRVGAFWPWPLRRQAARAG